MKKGVIATDLDGTLTATKRDLEPDVKTTLEFLSTEGWEILFLTGRFYTYAQELLVDCTFPYYLGVQNGSSLIFPQENKCFFSHKLSFDSIPFLEKIIAKFPVFFALESGMEHDDMYFRQDSGLLESKETTFLDGMEEIYFATTESRERRLRKVNCLSDAYPFGDFSVAKVLGKLEFLDQIRRVILDSDFSRVVSTTMITHPFFSECSIMHITPKEGTKEDALEYFLSNISHNTPFVIAAGDDENDIGLLKCGSFKIVMETAPKKMHALADYLCPSSKQQGIILGLQQGVAAFENSIH